MPMLDASWLLLKIEAWCNLRTVAQRPLVWHSSCFGLRGALGSQCFQGPSRVGRGLPMATDRGAQLALNRLLNCAQEHDNEQINEVKIARM